MLSGTPQAGRAIFAGGDGLKRRLGRFPVAHLGSSKGGRAAMAEVSNDNVDDCALCRDGNGSAGDSFSDGERADAPERLDKVTDIESRAGFKREAESSEQATEIEELLLPWSVACDGLFWETPSVLAEGNPEAVRYLFDPIRVSYGFGLQAELELLAADCLAEEEQERESSHSQAQVGEE